jgi:GTP-binding protein
VKGVPIVAVSGMQGDGLDRLMQAVVDAYAVWNRRVATNPLNRWFEDAVSSHPPPQ